MKALFQLLEALIGIASTDRHGVNTYFVCCVCLFFKKISEVPFIIMDSSIAYNNKNRMQEKQFNMVDQPSNANKVKSQQDHKIMKQKRSSKTNMQICRQKGIFWPGTKKIFVSEPVVLP